KIADPRQGEVPGEFPRLENTGDEKHCGESCGREEHHRNETGDRPLHRVLCLHVALFWLLASNTTTSSMVANTQEVRDTTGPPVSPSHSSTRAGHREKIRTSSVVALFPTPTPGTEPHSKRSHQENIRGWQSSRNRIPRT